MKIAICMVVRDEEASILEWIAFHAVVGFTSFLIFDDRSTDATVARAALAGRKLDVRVLPWAELQASHHSAGYEKICRRFAGEFDWIAFLDADEFLVPWPQTDITALLTAQAAHAAVVVPWQMFGSSGHIKKPPGLMIESFTRRAGPAFGPSRHVKSIVRPGRVTGAVNAHYFAVDGTYALPDGATPAWEKLGILQSYPEGLNWYINHYFTRSKEHWAERMRRGQITGHTRSPKEFYENDRNEVLDDRAVGYAPGVKILLRQALRHDHVLVACARWETQYIAEWLSYHRLLGFDHVYLYCNDDNPEELRQAVLPFILGPDPFVTFLHYPEIGAQQDMYLHYLRNFKDLAAWMCFLDIDEFIRLPNHGTIGQFIATFPRDTDSIYFNWCFFGNSGFAERPPGQVLLNYTRRAGHLYNHMTKHITRAAAIDVNRIRLGPMSDFWHYWDSLENFRDLKIVNVLGQDMHEYYDSGGALIAALREPGVFENLARTGIINHYAFKSRKDFLIRFERGVNGVFAQQEDYQKAYYDGRAEMILARLDEVDDLELATLWRRRLDLAQTACSPPSALELFPEFHPAAAPALPPPRRAAGPAEITGSASFAKPSPPANTSAKHAPRLGIAITTFNRRAMLLAQIDALQALTTRIFTLVVCDDGSSDGTRDSLATRGVTTIGGTNRGIAWNKNRGLFYLREIAGCDVILLLDDDILPVRAGWQEDWLAVVETYGHINFLPAGANTISGRHTPADPAVAKILWGPCIAFSRDALSYVGYMDTRFKAYGHEHTDLTQRAIRAGFGGFAKAEEERGQYFYSIEGGLRLLHAGSYADQESAKKNEPLLRLSEQEPIHRHAWRGHEEYQMLRREVDEALGRTFIPSAEPKDQITPPPMPAQAVSQAAPLRNLALGKAATQSSICRWSRGLTPAQDAQSAVTGIATGKRNFHTALEFMPWWQIDLGQPCVISQIKILNTTEADVRDRFTRFKISIINDDGVWVDVCAKEDGASVGGAGAPFIWQPNYAAGGRLIRITLLGFGYLHLDQVEVFASPNGAATAIPPVSDQTLFANFISLGDNCEFGLIQRAAGIEPLDLLRFAGTGRDEAGLQLALRERFAAFASAAELTVTDDGGEWITRCPRYTMTFHTNRYPRDTDLAGVREDEAKRLPFLARKIVDDLTNSSKIFVRKSNRPVEDTAMIEMYKAMQTYGKPALLWVTLIDDEHPNPTVRRLAPGLLRGYIRRFAPYEMAKDIRIQDWRDLCGAAGAAMS